MPIDYLKILSKDNTLANRLYNNPLLKKFSVNQKFNNKLDRESNIKQATYIHTYKEILFCFFTKDEVFTKLEILIKPHYYFNDNLHNANDFSAIDCIKTLLEIKNTFDLPTNKLTILNIEFGLNDVSPINCQNLITYAMYHEKNEFINSSDSLRFSKISFKHRKDGKANKYKQVKFYAKGLQFPTHTDINTFRFEIKSKESKYIKTFGIYTYEDLLRIEPYHRLANKLRLEFKKVLILDIDNKGKNLTNKELLKLDEYRNSIKWIRSLQGSRNLFNKYKIRYFKLLDKTEDNIHKKLEFIIDKKLKELLKECAISTPFQKIKEYAISDVYIIGNRTQNKVRRCIITGISLEHETKNAKYIRTSTLKYLKKHDIDTFNNLCCLLLSNTKDKRPTYENNLIKHLAKQIRNRYYNKLSIRQVGYRKKTYSNQLEFIYPTPPY